MARMAGDARRETAPAAGCSSWTCRNLARPGSDPGPVGRGRL